MANNDNSLLNRLGLIEEQGDPNVIPLAYYLDDSSNKICINILKTTRKIRNLRTKNVIAYCVDDPKPPFKGVRGKGVVEPRIQ